MQKNIDDGKNNRGCLIFIKENYPNYFESNEVMEKKLCIMVIYLKYGYKDKNNDYADLGMDGFIRL